MTKIRWSDRARSLLQKLESSRNISQGRPWILGVALVVFVAISVASLMNLPDTPRSPDPIYVVPILLLTVATLLINGLEFKVAGSLASRTVPLDLAIQTSVLSSAANVLPIPGAALVRVRALREVEVSYKRAIMSTTVVGVAWLGASAAGAGVLLIWEGFLVAGSIMVVLGILAMVLGPVLMRAADSRVLSSLLAVEFGSMIITTLRLFFIAKATGLDISLSTAATLGLSGVLASAAGLFPGGLGLREGLSAAMAPLTESNASVAVVISALDRIVFYVVLAIAAFVLILIQRRRTSEGVPVTEHLAEPEAVEDGTASRP